MSKNHTGSGGGLVTLVSGVYAYTTTPEFTGLKGVFGSALVGSGTSIIAGVHALGGGVAGAALGALAMSFSHNKSDVKAGAVGGLLIGGLAAGVYGIPQGYSYSKDIVLNGVEPAGASVEDMQIAVPPPAPAYVIDPIEP